MTAQSTAVELDARLGAALPQISEEGKILARRVAHLLAEGEPLDSERIARARSGEGSGRSMTRSPSSPGSCATTTTGWSASGG